MYKVFLAATMLFTIAANAQTQPAVEKKTKPRIIQHHTTNDESTIEISRDDVRYRLELNGEEVTRFVVNGKEIPQADYSKYEDTINKIKADVKRDREQAEKDRIRADRDRADADRDRADAERDRLQAERDRVQADKDREQAEKDRARAEKDREQAEKDRLRAEEDRKVYDAMISDLISDKIIGSKRELERFTFTSQSLTINGKEQPKEIFEKYKKKYVRFQGQDVTYIDGGRSARIRKTN